MSERVCAKCHWFDASEHEGKPGGCTRCGQMQRADEDEAWTEHPQHGPGDSCAYFERPTEGPTRLELEARAKAADAHARHCRAGYGAEHMRTVTTSGEARDAWLAVAESMRPADEA